MRKIIVIILINCYITIIFSQNIILQNDGKKINARDFRIENPDIIFYKNQKNKIKSIESAEVFALIDSTGKETLIYKTDTSYSGAFSISEMRSFVNGQTDAIEKYKAPWITAGGVVVSGVSAVVVNPVYLILVSGAYCTGAGIIPPGKKKLGIPDEFASNEPYILGYKKAVKHKRIKNSIIGSVIGLGIGLGTAAIINNN